MECGTTGTTGPRAGGGIAGVATHLDPGDGVDVPAIWWAWSPPLELVGINLMTDLLCAFLDPRVRYE